MSRFPEARDLLREAENSIAFSRSALEEMQVRPIQAIDLHRRWREYLTNWSRAWDYIREAAKKTPNKQLSDSMNNRHKKHCVAKYLFQARHSDTHVGRVVDPTPTSLNIGGFVSINSDNVASIVVKDNFRVNSAGVAHRLPEFIGSIERGDVKGEMFESENIAISNAYLKLLPATNRSGTYAVPKIGESEESRAVLVATDGLAFLGAAYEQVAQALIQDE